MLSGAASRLAVMSTRLFPKGRGAAAYQVTGIASRCDWVVLSDERAPHTMLSGDTNRQPRSVFLSLRSCFRALDYFYREVLPAVSEPFVLISGSEDTTIPTQVDARWRRFNAAERNMIERITADERVVHWFAENLDTLHPKMSPLPLGYVPLSVDQADYVEVPNAPPLSERKPAALCAHRIREGRQWDTRRMVSKLCETSYRQCCSLVDQTVGEEEFVRLIEEHVFVLCVEGGGLDPSPKAWLAMLHGAIPVVRSSTVDAAYRQLPVVIIDEWNSDAISPKKLDYWLRSLRVHYEDPDARERVLYKLSLNYWWQQIVNMQNRGRSVPATTLRITTGPPDWGPTSSSDRC